MQHATCTQKLKENKSIKVLDNSEESGKFEFPNSKLSHTPSFIHFRLMT